MPDTRTEGLTHYLTDLKDVEKEVTALGKQQAIIGERINNLEKSLDRKASDHDLNQVKQSAVSIFEFQKDMGVKIDKHSVNINENTKNIELLTEQAKGQSANINIMVEKMNKFFSIRNFGIAVIVIIGLLVADVQHMQDVFKNISLKGFLKIL